MVARFWFSGKSNSKWLGKVQAKTILVYGRSENVNGIFCCPELYSSSWTYHLVDNVFFQSTLLV